MTHELTTIALRSLGIVAVVLLIAYVVRRRWPRRQLGVVSAAAAAAITIAIAVTSWTGTARLVRAQTLAVEARPFVERARALGAGNVQIMVRQVLPNVAPLILVSATLTVASAILSETTLTFLGLGDSTEVSWGGMLNDAGTYFQVDPEYLFAPGIALFLAVLSFNLFGDGLRDALDPRSRR